MKTAAFILVGAFVGYLVGDALAPTIAVAGVALGAIFGAGLACERKP